jgi:hypothetical protein
VLPAQVLGKNYTVTHDFCRDLSLCTRGHSVRREWIEYHVFCFAVAAHAELFRERFGGERFTCPASIRPTTCSIESPRRRPRVRQGDRNSGSAGIAWRCPARPPISPRRSLHCSGRSGSNNPLLFAPNAAEPSMPIDPVSIAASSDRMSPNMLPVTITSRRRISATPLRRR